MNISQATIEEIKKMNISEKILIVEDIWDSIVAEEDYPELTNEQYTELNRRIDSFYANPEQGRTWNEIKNDFWKQKKLNIS